jgi:hypothetical protein
LFRNQGAGLVCQKLAVLTKHRVLLRLNFATTFPLGELAQSRPNDCRATPTRGPVRQLIQEFQRALVNSNSNSFHIVDGNNTSGRFQYRGYANDGRGSSCSEPITFDKSTGEFVDAGGLMYHEADLSDNYRRVAIYVDTVLRGAKPADLPVEQPTKFELVISLKTAKQIGLTIPPNVVARADRVIR